MNIFEYLNIFVTLCFITIIIIITTTKIVIIMITNIILKRGEEKEKPFKITPNPRLVSSFQLVLHLHYVPPLSILTSWLAAIRPASSR